MKKLILFCAILFCTFSISAQVTLNVSPFKHLPKPVSNSLFKATLSNQQVTAYRFVLPFAGYSPITKQISTGIGYGWNKLHLDSTGNWYTDVAIFGAIFVNGDLTPSPYNFTSVGVGIGVLNNLVMIVPAYNLPTSQFKSGSFDLKISFGLTFK